MESKEVLMYEKMKKKKGGGAHTHALQMLVHLLSHHVAEQQPV